MRPLLRLVPLLLAVALSACDTQSTSVYDPDRQPLADPVLSDVSPSGSALAGIDVLTITGQNFSPTPENNLVYFGTERGVVVESSPTVLRVRSPNTPGEGISIRVAVLGRETGAENYSNSLTYALVSADVPVGDIARTGEVFGIASDGAGGALLSLFNENASDNVQRLGVDGMRSLYFTTSFRWQGLTLNTDGVLYGVRGVQAVFGLPEGGSQQVFAVAPSGFQFTTIAADASGNLWTGGNHNNGADSRAIYRVAPDRSLAAFPFEARIRDLIVFNDFLWAVGEEASGASKVWRFSLAGGTLGSAEEVVTVFQNDDPSTPPLRGNALAASADGALFIGTDAADPLLVYEGGSISPLYPGILTAPITGLAWGAGSQLYTVRGRVFDPDGNLLVFPAIIRVETRRTGAASLQGSTSARTRAF